MTLSHSCIKLMFLAEQRAAQAAQAAHEAAHGGSAFTANPVVNNEGNMIVNNGGSM